MTQTMEGGKKAAETNHKRHGKLKYRLAGFIGGKAKVKKGFAMNKALASTAGAKGGRNGKRGPARKATMIITFSDGTCAVYKMTDIYAMALDIKAQELERKEKTVKRTTLSTRPRLYSNAVMINIHKEVE